MRGFAEVRVLDEGRRQRKKRALRARIYETARRLFLAQGVAATTVEQIAAAADIAPATFFNHFQNKDGLLGEMTAEVFDRLQTLIDESLLPPAPTEERIARFADRAAREIAAARGLAHDVLLDFVRSGPEPRAALPYVPRAHASFTAVMREGQARGEVRTDCDAVFLAEMVVGALNAALVNWMNDSRYPLEERLRMAAVFIGEAIRPRAVSGTIARGRTRKQTVVRKHGGPRR